MVQIQNQALIRGILAASLIPNLAQKKSNRVELTAANVFTTWRCMTASAGDRTITQEMVGTAVDVLTHFEVEDIIGFLLKELSGAGYSFETNTKGFNVEQTGAMVDNNQVGVGPGENGLASLQKENAYLKEQLADFGRQASRFARQAEGISTRN